MADDSELDYIRTFMGKVHTTATAKSRSEVMNLSQINDTTRILVFPPEIVGSFLNVFIKRYKVQLSDVTEALLTTMLDNILDGINKCNKRTAISEFTKPNTWINIRFISANKAYEHHKKGSSVWFQDIIIEIDWGT